MTFEWPLSLLGLVVVALFAMAYVWSIRRRRRYALAYSNIGIVRAASASQARKRHLPAMLYLIALTAGVVAMARPAAVVPTLESYGTIILIVDSSGSMRNIDIRPTRIEAAQAAVRQFVNRQPDGVRIGLVAFAGSAALLTPPTDDKQVVIDSVNRLQLERGTNIGDGLRIALEAITDPDGLAPTTLETQAQLPQPGRIDNAGAVSFILLSDGAATTGPPPLDVAAAVAAAGIKVSTVGLGTRQFGSGFMRLDESTLRGIADRTGGKYYTAENASDLREVYGQLARDQSIGKKHQEVTFAAAAIAALFLLASGALGLASASKLP